MLNRLSKVVAVVLVLLPFAGAQQTRVYQDSGKWTQEITGSLESARHLQVQVDAGSVRVEGGSQSGITYVVRNRSYSSSEDSARREFTSYKISTSVHGNVASIVGEWQGRPSHRFSGEFVINVPQAMESVKIETGGGAVSATGIAGSVTAETGGGAIKLDNIGGSVSAETGGDKIEIGTIGGDAKIETGGGAVSIGNVKGAVNASTGGGDLVLVSSERDAVLEAGGGNIQVQRCRGRLRVSTGGGNIELGDVSGPVEVETGGGSIRLASARGQVRAETGAGRIELNGVPSAHAQTGAGAIVAKLVSGSNRTDSLLETAVGDVTVYLAPNLNITVRADIEMANGHNIRSDFPEIHIRTEGEWGPKTVTAEGNLNGGGPILKIRTTTGNIMIARGQ